MKSRWKRSKIFSFSEFFLVGQPVAYMFSDFRATFQKFRSYGPASESPKVFALYKLSKIHCKSYLL